MSPCGQFVAAHCDFRVEIRDAISSELVSTLSRNIHGSPSLAYSPDGRSLACSSYTLMIWDIQTGGGAKEIEYDNESTSSSGSIVWSLDGMTVGMTQYSTVHLYDVASGATWSPGTLQSGNKLHLWAHNRSFRVVAIRWGGGVFTIEVFDVGSDLVKIESFHIESPRGSLDPDIASFSPTTYRVSISDGDQTRILDIRNSECLLEEEGLSECHTFSSDGSLFAASLECGVHIWRYTSGCYTPWRTFPAQSWCPPIFSPTSSSILIYTPSGIHAYPLDAPPIVAQPDGPTLLAILSPCGTYIATARRLGHTVTIANPLSQITSQFIDTDMEIKNVALTGSILLVFDGEQVAAWRLTEGGLVDGVFGDRRARDGDSIWVASIPTSVMITDRSAVFFNIGEPIHIYHTGTGEVLDNTQGHYRKELQFSPMGMHLGRHYPHYRNSITGHRQPIGDWPISGVYPEAGWVKDLEGKHRLWMPIEWRGDRNDMGWLCDIQALWFNRPPGSVIIMFRF